MPDIKFGCRPTMIGSMPQDNPEAACTQVNRFLKDVPAWPQLPNRSFLENMYAQYSQGFPGITIENGRIYVDRSRNIDSDLEALYKAYIENEISKFPVTADYAAGLHCFLNRTQPPPLLAKGQVTGPVTWGLTVTDETGKAVLYDDVLGDAAAKLLRLKAAWQEKELQKISRNTIIFVDEPYLEAYGSSSFITITRDKVKSLLEEVFGGVSGLKGVHCCGNTDWSILAETSADILSFDAYNYAQSLQLYPAQIRTFLTRQGRKGAIAWGIIPNTVETLSRETAASLSDRLEEAMAPFSRDGLPFRQLVEQSLVTPCCGLAKLPPDASERALELLADVSALMRKRYL